MKKSFLTLSTTSKLADMEQFDSSLYRRMIRDCIKKRSDMTMTTLIQDEQKRQKIMARMREHLVPVLEHCRGGWVGLFLQGSQNYNLDYEGSDIDTKAIMLPSFSDFVLNAKPLSTTHIMEITNTWISKTSASCLTYQEAECQLC